jgi:hypothetical protein
VSKLAINIGIAAADAALARPTRRTLPKGCSKYGANMGRRSDWPEDRSVPIMLMIERLQWVDGDYDQGGAYWGGFIPDRDPPSYIFWAYGEDDENQVDIFVRAKSLADAERKIRHGDPGNVRGAKHLPHVSFVYPNPCEPNESDLDAFVDAYLETCLDVENDEPSDKPLSDRLSTLNFAEGTAAAMRADCEKFLRENAKDVDGAFSCAGSDFYLSRNECSGFLDHADCYPEGTARRLHEAARGYRQHYISVGDDGQIHAD